MKNVLIAAFLVTFTAACSNSTRFVPKDIPADNSARRETSTASAFEAKGVFNSSFDALPMNSVIAIEPLSGTDMNLVLGQEINATNGSRDFVITRTIANQIDATFGQGGKTSIDFGGLHDAPSGLLVLPDQSILVSGYSAALDGSAARFSLAKLKMNGELDTSFGSNGKMHYLTSGYNVGARVALQADGKILFVGRQGKTTPIGTLIRLLPDGSQDSSFATSEFPMLALYSVDIQADGKPVVAGIYQPAGVPISGAVVRFGKDGGVDGTFGTRGDGLQAVSYGRTTSQAARLKVLSNDKILVCGTSYNTNGYFVGSAADLSIARLQANGTPDLTFNGGLGYNVIDLGKTEFARALAIQSNGKIVIGGESMQGTSVTAPLASDIGLARLTEDGMLDSSFGSGGLLHFNLGAPSTLSAIAVAGDGKILAAGQALGGNPSTGAVVQIR